MLSLSMFTGCGVKEDPTLLLSPMIDAAQEENDSAELSQEDVNAEGPLDYISEEWYLYFKNPGSPPLEGATLTLYSDGTFHLNVNLYGGFGNIYGTYQSDGNRMKCDVISRDFEGFLGDDVETFDFVFDGYKLLYVGDDIGMMGSGHILRLERPTP